MGVNTFKDYCQARDLAEARIPGRHLPNFRGGRPDPLQPWVPGYPEPEKDASTAAGDILRRMGFTGSFVRPPRPAQPDDAPRRLPWEDEPTGPTFFRQDQPPPADDGRPDIFADRVASAERGTGASHISPELSQLIYDGVRRGETPLAIALRIADQTGRRVPVAQIKRHIEKNTQRFGHRQATPDAFGDAMSSARKRKYEFTPETEALVRDLARQGEVPLSIALRVADQTGEKVPVGAIKRLLGTV